MSFIQYADNKSTDQHAFLLKRLCCFLLLLRNSVMMCVMSKFQFSLQRASLTLSWPPRHNFVWRDSISRKISTYAYKMD